MNKCAEKGDPAGMFLKPGMWRQYNADVQQELLPLGSSYADTRLRGGISRGALHEFFGATKDDAVIAGAFALMLALRLPDPGLRIFWIMGDTERQASGRLYPPGIAELGADPARMALIQTANLQDSLRAAADIIRSKATGAVILEVQGNSRMIDLTATRRLALAAAEKTVLTLLVRSEAARMPSAASTRWQIGPAASLSLPADAPGLPSFSIRLLRHRGGIAPFETKVIWDHAERIFHDAPLLGGLSSAAFGRKADPGKRANA